jgi:uncharacterized membrane protein YraQ (UPF0718 family)
MAQLTSADSDQQAAPNEPATTVAHRQVTTVDLARIRYGACLIGAAFVLLGVVFSVAIMHFRTASDVVAVVGSVATVVGTIVAAFFGIQAASSSKAAAEAGRAHAEQTARLALSKLDPQAAEDVLKRL